MTDTPVGFAEDLPILRTALRRSRDLGLSEAQLEKLQSLYAEALRDLGEATEPGAAAEIKNRANNSLLELLGNHQRGALLTLATDTNRDGFLIDAIRETVDARVKDRAVVEIDTAAAVLERLVGWAKLFAWCVALPVGLLTAIFVVAGIGKYADFVLKVNRYETKIQKLVAQSEQRLSETAKQAEDVAARYQQRLADLEKSVGEIKERLVGAPGATLPSALLSTLSKDFEKLQAHLVTLGYKPDRREIGFAYAEAESGSVAYYVDGTIYVAEKYASNIGIVLREYLHHVLWEGVGKPFERAGEKASALESGLADYFVASFLNDPRPYKSDSSTNLAQVKRLSGDRVDRFRTGEIWACAFWALRKALDRPLADRILFEAWAAKSVEVAGDSFTEMAQSILATTSKLAGSRQAEVAGILRERGLLAE